MTDQTTSRDGPGVANRAGEVAGAKSSGSDGIRTGKDASNTEKHGVESTIAADDGHSVTSRSSKRSTSSTVKLREAEIRKRLAQERKEQLIQEHNLRRKQTELTEKIELLKINNEVWRDDFLGWNESEYAGINRLQVEVDKIWSPTVTLLTSNSPDFLQMNHRRVDISSEGEVIWLSPAIITSTCYFDVQFFPFDVQTCVFKFGPWASPHTVEDLDFFFEGNETSVHRYRENGVWEILHETVKKKCGNYSSNAEPYAEIHYQITFRRMSKVYVLGIIIPSVLLSLSTMLIFLLPPESGEKISFGITNLLAMVLFLNTVSSAMPPNGSPIFAVYICAMVAIACLTLMVEAVVLRMYNHSNTRAVPRWMLRMFVSHPACFRSSLYHLPGHAEEPTHDGLQQNRSRVGHPDDKDCEVERRCQPCRVLDSDKPDSTELWRLVALSFEKKAAVVMSCFIAGNFVFTALRITIGKAEEASHVMTNSNDC